MLIYDDVIKKCHVVFEVFFTFSKVFMLLSMSDTSQSAVVLYPEKSMVGVISPPPPSGITSHFLDIVFKKILNTYLVLILCRVALGFTVLKVLCFWRFLYKVIGNKRLFSYSRYIFWG